MRAGDEIVSTSKAILFHNLPCNLRQDFYQVEFFLHLHNLHIFVSVIVPIYGWATTRLQVGIKKSNGKLFAFVMIGDFESEFPSNSESFHFNIIIKLDYDRIG